MLTQVHQSSAHCFQTGWSECFKMHAVAVQTTKCGQLWTWALTMAAANLMHLADNVTSTSIRPAPHSSMNVGTCVR